VQYHYWYSQYSTACLVTMVFYVFLQPKLQSVWLQLSFFHYTIPNTDMSRGNGTFSIDGVLRSYSMLRKTRIAGRWSKINCCAALIIKEAVKKHWSCRCPPPEFFLWSVSELLCYSRRDPTGAEGGQHLRTRGETLPKNWVASRCTGWWCGSLYVGPWHAEENSRRSIADRFGYLYGKDWRTLSIRATQMILGM